MKLWAKLRHPNVVPFIGFRLDGDVACLVSAWAANGDVKEYLSANKVDSTARLRIVAYSLTPINATLTLSGIF